VDVRLFDRKEAAGGSAGAINELLQKISLCATDLEAHHDDGGRPLAVVRPRT
jgi:hypothetical protein